MSKDNFYKNSIILTFSNLITGILKFMFSIILSCKLGAQGMGLYSLIMPVYDFFAVIVCGGMITAVSKECASFYSKNDFANLHKSIRICLIFDLVWSVLIALVLFLFSPLICNTVIKDNRALYSLWLICPAIVFIALSAILKGYFYGISKMTIPSVIDICEKGIRMTVIVSIITILNLHEITRTVTVTYLALSAGELVSFILLFCFYKKNKFKYTISYSKSEKGIKLLSGILAISLPLCINGILTTGLSTASTLLLPQRLIAAGIPHGKALAIIGKFSGMAMSITFFPFIAIMSISTVLIPNISENLSKGNYALLEKRFVEVIKIAFIIGLSTLVICMSLPNSLGELFFKRNDLGEFIKLAALSTPISYVSATTFGILNGLGKQKVVLKNSVLSALIELFLIYVLCGMPSINIYGFGISIIITSSTVLFLNMIEIKKDYSLDFSTVNLIIDILLGIFVYLILRILNTILPNQNSVIKSLSLLIIGFATFIFATAIFNENDNK
ncbi:stage V sporulation protein B [Haloimpatiens sp. FM7330]|uniref:stage V sporulation protein B n=1 Tax=Haloimpatiens sp. FM7330 TaxID=3298610 RepID=UPI003633F57B